VGRRRSGGDRYLGAVPPATAYVVYAPYLPLKERVVVGDWELIPQRDLQARDALDERVSQLARGLAELYDLRDRAGAFGAFARPLNGCVGDDPTDVAPIRRALVVAVLDGNQSPLTPADERDPNAGHAATTSENALARIVH